MGVVTPSLFLLAVALLLPVLLGFLLFRPLPFFVCLGRSSLSSAGGSLFVNPPRDFLINGGLSHGRFARRLRDLYFLGLGLGGGRLSLGSHVELRLLLKSCFGSEVERPVTCLRA